MPMRRTHIIKMAAIMKAIKATRMTTMTMDIMTKVLQVSNNTKVKDQDVVDMILRKIRKLSVISL